MLSGEKKKDNKFPVCKISTCLLFADIVMSNLWIVTQVMNSCIEGEKERGKREKEDECWVRSGVVYGGLLQNLPFLCLSLISTF